MTRPRTVLLIVGPPCAGKTTWVRQHASPDDLIVDWDQLAQQAGSPVEHDHHKHYQDEASRHRTHLEHQVARMTDGTAFVIRTLPNLRHRNDTAHRLQAIVKIIDPGEQVCIQRAKANGRTQDTINAIHYWYRQTHALT